MGFFDAFRSTKSDAPPSQSLVKTGRHEAQRIKSILGMRSIESMPAQATRAFQLASDPKAGTTEFVEIIEQDEALSARIVRVANSVYFYRGTQVVDIEQAVAAIGLSELRCLISATMLKNLLQGKDKVRSQLWANSVGTALAARMIAPRMMGIDEGEAFLCGLLHDVGKLVMIRAESERYQTALARVNEETDIILAEESVYELNHVDVGSWISDIWNFPDCVRNTVLMHHNPWPEDFTKISETERIPFLIKAADCIAHACGLGHQNAFSALKMRAKAELHLAQKYIGFEDEPFKSFLEQFEKRFPEEFDLYQLEGA